MKPAHEPVCFARKPLSEATVAANVLRWATGAINVDACLVGEDGDMRAVGRGRASAGVYGNGLNSTPAEPTGAGRWPANVVTDGSLEVLEAFPPSARDAIRFFYAAKAGKDEREDGLRDAGVGALRDAGRGSAPRRLTGEEIKGRAAGSAGSLTAHSGIGNGLRANFHPTVKPVDLMRWLCRLVTPPGGVVLDPFMGSGSTGIAAAREGFRFVGIERDPEYFDIACRRIAHAVTRLDNEPDMVRNITEAISGIRRDSGQGDLF